MFKLISEDSVLLTYGKWHENDKLTFFFNKELEQVDIEYQIFERNADCYFFPQDENSHSCKYGYWRVEAPCLSMEDIEFLHRKTKELWGNHQTEKGGAE